MGVIHASVHFTYYLYFVFCFLFRPNGSVLNFGASTEYSCRVEGCTAVNHTNQGRRQEFFQGRVLSHFQIPGRGSNPIFWSLQWSQWKNFRARGGPWPSPAYACLRLWHQHVFKILDSSWIDVEHTLHADRCWEGCMRRRVVARITDYDRDGVAWASS